MVVLVVAAFAMAAAKIASAQVFVSPVIGRFLGKVAMPDNRTHPASTTFKNFTLSLA